MTSDQWRAKPMIFVEDIEHPHLSDSDLHHYRRVRRIQDGSEVTISDGAGAWVVARFGAEPTPEGPVHVAPAPAAPSTVGFVPVKGDRPELVVQKLTELGVDVILPIQSTRSVVRWDEGRAAKHLAKWQLIAREASMQSRRVRVPTISAMAPLAEVLKRGQVVFAEPGGRPLDPSTDRFVLIGPEGGWAPEEISGHEQRSLPGGILRAETAAIAAGVLLATAS